MTKELYRKEKQASHAYAVSRVATAVASHTTLAVMTGGISLAYTALVASYSLSNICVSQGSLSSEGYASENMHAPAQNLNIENEKTTILPNITTAIAHGLLGFLARPVVLTVMAGAATGDLIGYAMKIPQSVPALLSKNSDENLNKIWNSDYSFSLTSTAHDLFKRTNILGSLDQHMEPEKPSSYFKRSTAYGLGNN